MLLIASLLWVERDVCLLTEARPSDLCGCVEMIKSDYTKRRLLLRIRFFKNDIPVQAMKNVIDCEWMLRRAFDQTISVLAFTSTQAT